MIWSSFVMGGMTVIMAYALFSGEQEDELEVEILDPEPDDHQLIVNDFSGRLHTLYCENCRKKKKHREIRPRIFECTRCKRNTDLRIPS
ncbi:hypothetical protein [Neobacillus niacini]|uniref:hypothetical protein n=1 Tax=Neobacillus niacini TaxID=86668 RepID=UPI0021CB68BE|nr:hypothetical protein [Neobacillus niacini]MCM3763421.1 hypothetical protein [Neobacillus niacini]